MRAIVVLVASSSVFIVLCMQGLTPADGQWWLAAAAVAALSCS
ncbi:hypothetical protein ACLKMY_00590 [Paraburkholderia mimosarum]